MKKKPLPAAKVPLASGVPVYCTFTKIVPAAELADKLWKGNMKKHSAANLDAALAVVVGTDKRTGNGWRRAVVVSSFSGMVTKGNGMVQMALRHNLDVPIEIQAYKSRREEIRDLIADNALPKHSTDDKDALKKLLDELEQTDIAATAITEDEINELIGKLSTDLPKIEDKKKQAKSVTIDAMYQVIVECKTEADQKATLEKLEKEGLKCRLLTL